MTRGVTKTDHWAGPRTAVALRLQHAPHGQPSVTQFYDDVLRPSGLRVTQFSILASIARVGEPYLPPLDLFGSY